MATATAQPTQNDSNTLPVYLSIPLILLCLAAGGWIIHYYVMSDPISHEVTLLGDPPANPGPGMGRNRPPNFRNNPAADVHELNNNRWAFRTMQASINVTVSGGKPNLNVIRYENDESFVPADVKAVNFALRDKAKIAAMHLTDDEQKKLQPLASNINMVASTADRSELANQVMAYVQAAEPQRQQLETKIYQTIDEVAQRSQDATRKKASDRAAQIKAILTPDQWKLAGGK